MACRCVFSFPILAGIRPLPGRDRPGRLWESGCFNRRLPLTGNSPTAPTAPLQPSHSQPTGAHPANPASRHRQCHPQAGVSVVATGGTFSLSAGTGIYVEPATDEVKAIGQYLADHLNPATGYALKVQAANGAACQGDLT